MTAKAFWLSICIGMFTQLSWAQPTPADRYQQAEDLRSQIERMEQKLRSLEETDKENRGIAQIGNTKVRTADETRLVVRMYDLSELATGGLGGALGGGGFGGAFSVPDKPRTIQSDRPAHLAQVEARTSINTLVSAIQSVISPTSWDTVGGPMSISQLGNALIVSADANTHSQIEKLLDLFHKRWGTLKTVSVRAWWLPLTESQVDELVTGDGADKKLPAFGIVDEAAFKKFLESQNQADTPVGYRAVITCYNGQTVHAVAGDQSLAVTDIEVVAAKGDANSPRPIAYSPALSLIQEGAALQVTPIVTISGKYVVLDIHSRVNRRLSDDQRAKGAAGRATAAKADSEPASAANVVAALDRPRLAVQRLSTTLRIPVDSTMLIGGMTMNENATAKDPTLYLFVKLMVQELRDGAKGEAPAEAKPAAAAAATGGERARK